jgi:hypothetical protein
MQQQLAINAYIAGEKSRAELKKAITIKEEAKYATDN